MTDISLTADNDNPGGSTEIRLALIGLTQLLAKAEAGRAVRVMHGHDTPANTNHAPRKGDAK